MGRPLLTFGLLLMMLVCGGNLVLLRRRRSPEIAAHLTLSVAFIMMILANLSQGNLDDPSFGWLYLLPLAAILTTGLRGGWLWIAVAMLTAIGFWLLPPHVEIPGIAIVADSGLRTLFHRLAGPLAVGLDLGAPLRRHRAGARDFEQSGRDDGWRDRTREHSRSGLDFLVSAAAVARPILGSW